MKSKIKSDYADAVGFSLRISASPPPPPPPKKKKKKKKRGGGGGARGVQPSITA